MNIRTTFVLAVLLLLVGGYVFLAEETPEEPEVIGIDAPQFYTVSESDINQITIQAAGFSGSFVRSDEGPWLFDEPNGPPVDLGRWGGVTLLLGGPDTQRLLAETVENPAEYGLDEPSIEIEFTLTGDRKERILLGSTTLNGGFHFAMREGDPQLYLVSSLWGQVLGRLAVDPPYPPWYYKVAPERVRFLSVTHGDATIDLTNDLQGNWREATDARTPVDPTRWATISPILGGPPSFHILEDKLEDFAKYGLLEPQTVIYTEVEPPAGLEAESRRPIEIEVGDPIPGESAYYAKVVGQPFLLFIDGPWYEIIRDLALDPPFAPQESG